MFSGSRSAEVRWSEKDALLAAGSACQNVLLACERVEIEDGINKPRGATNKAGVLTNKHDSVPIRKQGY